MLTLVKQLSRQLNLGVIIVIHDINMASRFCDRLVALHGGRLLTHGVPDDIMTGETLPPSTASPWRSFATRPMTMPSPSSSRATSCVY